MTYPEAIQPYYDADGLVGDPRFIGLAAVKSSRWSGGNQLLFSSIDMLIRHKLECLTQDDRYRFTNAVTRCQVNGEKGIYDKNPPYDGKRRDDNLSWDDIMSVACISKILGFPFAQEIVDRARAHNWVMSNNGTFYGGAITKPWNKGFYLTCVGIKPDWLTRLMMKKAIDCNINENPADAGARQTMWLMTEAAFGVADIDEKIEEWRAHVRNLYGGINGVLALYYGENHPFAKFMLWGVV